MKREIDSLDYYLQNHTNDYSEESHMAMMMAIKALEQEPCDDCISRQAVIKHICESKECYKDECKGRLYKRCYDLQWIYDLPSVTPQPKIGHWILKHRTHNAVKHYTGQDEMGETHTISVLERYEVDEPYCSECGKLAGDTSQDYCCACGAKMENGGIMTYD